MDGDVFTPIRRSFDEAELAEIARAHGVRHTVLIQTRHEVDETEGLLGLAAESDLIAGVVGWVDLTSADVEAELRRLRSRGGGSKLVGVRHIVHDEEDGEWLLRADVSRGLAAVGRLDLTFDLLVRTRELPAALATVRRHPDVRFVIDHLAKPPIASGNLSAWKRALEPFGSERNAYCKFSGLVTEASWDRWRVEDLRPVVDFAMAVFGADRLLFGSDWPVCLLAATYDEVLEAAQDCVADRPEEDRTGVFGGNACKAYKLAI